MAGYDLSAACTGFIYALAQAYAQIAAGLAETVLVVGTEVFSRLLDWSDRSTCILFGDGAGAVVLRRDGRRHGLRGFELGADGSGAMLLSVAAAGHARRATTRAPYVQMNGAGGVQVRDAGGGRLVASAASRRPASTVEDVDVFVPHQANRRIIDHAARRLGLDEERVFVERRPLRQHVRRLDPDLPRRGLAGGPHRGRATSC